MKNKLQIEIRNAMKEVLIQLNNSRLDLTWEGIIRIYMDDNGNPSVHSYLKNKNEKFSEKVYGYNVKDNEVIIVQENIFSNDRKIKNEFESFIKKYKYEINELCAEEIELIQIKK